MTSDPRSSGIDFDDVQSASEWSPDTIDLFDHVAVWDDWRLPELIDEEARENDAELAELIHMMLASAKGYQELADLGRTAEVQSMGDVMLRQRVAIFHGMMKLLQADYASRYEHWIEALQTFDIDAASHRDGLMALKANWRLAMWHYEQNQIDEFVSYVLQAESILENALVNASVVLTDPDWDQQLKDHAVMVGGAKEVWVEFKLGSRN